MTIGADGIAREMKVIRSLDAGLDRKAMECVSQWRFRPATCTRQDGCNGIPRGQAVKVLVSVELTFTLR